MADNNFLLIINLIIEDEERHDFAILRRNLRDSSDPLSLPEAVFRSLYRLSRESAHQIILNLAPYMVDHEREQIAIPKQLKIFVALNYYAHGSYQKAVGLDHHIAMSQSSVSRCINEVTNLLIDHMHHFIKFPITDQEQTLIKEEFMEMVGVFPGIIRAIDCTHVVIIGPPMNNAQAPAILFLNRKGYYGFNVQIIVSAKLKILAINARYPGSVHDSAIWQTSAIKQHMITNYNNGNRSSWLIGDSGYPLEPWLMTPVSGNVRNEAERRYNNAHVSVRNVIERFNGVLKFRCIFKHRVLHYDSVTAEKIIYACAILHNFLIDLNDIYEIPDEDEDNDDDDIEPIPVRNYNNNNNNNNNNNWLHIGRNNGNRIINNYFN